MTQVRRGLGRLAVLLAVTTASGVGCQARDKLAMARAEAAELAARSQRFAARLAMPDPGLGGNKPLARWLLPHELHEVSGLALTGDGRLLAHGDNTGWVYEIDPRQGRVLKRFALGDQQGVVHDDFEGITIANGTIYMIASNGTLYEFEEGKDGARVSFTLHDTRLGHECEFEGVAYDPSGEALVLPCKTIVNKSLHDHLVLYRWNLRGSASPRISMQTIPLAPLLNGSGLTKLHPSDITIDPATGHYVLIASKQSALLEITPSGELVRESPLPGTHPQAEGVAVTRDGMLIIGDEATKQSVATITLYRWPLAGATSSKP
jgi:SdiA-regulated protein